MTSHLGGLVNGGKRVSVKPSVSVEGKKNMKGIPWISDATTMVTRENPQYVKLQKFLLVSQNSSHRTRIRPDVRQGSQQHCKSRMFE